jgi:hypothetical protein
MRPHDTFEGKQKALSVVSRSENRGIEMHRALFIDRNCIWLDRLRICATGNDQRLIRDRVERMRFPASP